MFNDPRLTTFEVDELDIRGHAHLGVQNKAGSVELLVNEYKGDFTATLQVGGAQSVFLNASANSVIPFTLRTYQVKVYFT